MPSRRKSSRGDYLDRVHIGLDYFDASINRVAAWVIGTRNMLPRLAPGAADPAECKARREIEGDYTARWPCQEEAKSLPFGAVWDYYCHSKSVPVGDAWLPVIKKYEQDVLLAR